MEGESPTLMLDSSNELIHIVKWETNDKSIAYFKTVLSIVDWKHMLNKTSPNNAYNKFLTIFFEPLQWGISKAKDKNQTRKF